MTTILITNDDGVHSQGIDHLRQALGDLGKTVIVAPDSDNSAVSHSLTIDRPLRIQKLKQDVYSVNGTPTDCVAIGLNSILDQKPDLLVSGINIGANLGDDISYSGTVSAAIEGTMYAIPSMAISVGGQAPYDFRAAMKIASCMAKKVLHNSLPKDTLLNINVPSGESVERIRITRQGRKLWENPLQETFDPWGNRHYWIGGGTPVGDPGRDTDVYVFSLGHVSVTPIQLDLTNHAGITYLRDNWQLEQ